MTLTQRQVVHALLRLGGAVVVQQVRRAPVASRVGQAIAFGLLGLAVADALDGARGTDELLRGVLAAVRMS